MDHFAPEQEQGQAPVLVQAHVRVPVQAQDQVQPQAQAQAPGQVPVQAESQVRPQVHAQTPEQAQAPILALAPAPPHANAVHDFVGPEIVKPATWLPVGDDLEQQEVGRIDKSKELRVISTDQVVV